MAFTAANMSVVGYGAGQKLWLYQIPVTDSTATVYGANYFGGTNTIPLMVAGDVILATLVSTTSVIMPAVVAAIGTTITTITRSI